MYFLKYHPLKQKLTERCLTDRDALPYFVIFMGLSTLGSSMPFLSGYNVWDIVSGIVSVVIAICGVIYAYRKNGGKAGYDFIQKFVILGWVVFIRFLLAFVPIIFALYLFFELTGLVSDESTNLFDVVVLAIAEMIFYQRIGRHIKDTNKINSEPAV